MKLDQKFEDSCNYRGVPIEWQEILYNYFVNGFQPGSFFTSVLANDLIGAANHSHVMNTWSAITCTCKWINDSAPDEAYGSYNAIIHWLSLTAEKRRAILEKKQLLSTAWDILNRP